MCASKNLFINNSLGVSYIWELQFCVDIVCTVAYILILQQENTPWRQP